MRYAWILEHREVYSTTMMCDLLSVSRSGLHQSVTRGPSGRGLDEEVVVDQIRRAQSKHRGRYGWRRIYPRPAFVPRARSAPDCSCDVADEAVGRLYGRRRRRRAVRTHARLAQKSVVAGRRLPNATKPGRGFMRAGGGRTRAGVATARGLQGLSQAP